VVEREAGQPEQTLKMRGREAREKKKENKKKRKKKEEKKEKRRFLIFIGV
jgi:hypothetical protein